MVTTSANGVSPLRAGAQVGLTFVDGKGVATIAEHRAVFPARLAQLEMAIPNLRFPFDLSGGPASFRHRRCALRQAKLSFDLEEIQRWLSERVTQAAYGFSELRLRFWQGTFQITGRVGLGQQHADFLLSGFVQRAGKRPLRISLCDLLLLGDLPVSAPLLASGLLSALGASPQGAAVQLEGCTEAVLDPLFLVLLQALPSSGWRLPSLTTVRLAGLELADDRLDLEYLGDEESELQEQATGTDLATPSPRLQRLLAHQRAKAACWEAERAILQLGPREAITRYQQLLDQRPQDTFILERLLQLTSADPERPELTLDLVARARQEAPQLCVAQLAEANLLLRQGKRLAASQRYREIADLAAEQGDLWLEIVAALAAGQHALAEDSNRAFEDLDRVLALDPDNERAIVQLARLHAEGGRWPSLIDLRQRQIALAATPEQRVPLHLALAEIFRVHLRQLDLAREQYQAALEIDGRCEPALRGLAEACIAEDDLPSAVTALEQLLPVCAELRDTAGETSVLLRLATLLEHQDKREAALQWLQRARELQPEDPLLLNRSAALLLALERPTEARQLLQQLAASSEASAQLDGQRQLASLALAEGDPEKAQRHLDQALTLAPRDPRLLVLALELAERSQDQDRLVAALRQAAAEARSPAKRAQLELQLGRLLALRPEAADEAAEILARAAAEAPDGGFAALQELAQLHHRQQAWSDEAACWARALESEEGAADPRSWYHLGAVRQHLGDLAGSAAALGRALELAAPGSEELRIAGLLLAEVTRQLGDDQLQRQALEKLLPGLPEEQDAAPQARLWLELARLQHRQSEQTQAAQTLAEAIARAPEDPALLHEAGALQHEWQQWAAAQETYRRALELIPPKAEAAPLRARLAWSLGQVQEELQQREEAQASYQLALAEGITGSEALAIWDRLIALALQRQDPVAAAQAASQAAQAEQDKAAQAERHAQAGLLLLDRANLVDRAIASFRRALELVPQHPAALEALEQIWSERQPSLADLVLVLQAQAEVTAKDPQRQKEVLTRLGTSLAEQGRQKDARTAFASALAIDGDNLLALLYLARSAHETQDWDLAESYSLRLTPLLDRSSSPLSPEERDDLKVQNQLRLADLARHRDEPLEEEGHLEMALAITPRHPRALARLDELLKAQGRGPELLDVIRRLLEVTTAPPEAAQLELRRAALLRTFPGRQEEALAAYRQVLQLQPGHAEALEQLLQILREIRHTDELLEVLEQRAQQAEREGQAEQAAALWREAAQLALEQPGDRDRVLRSLRQALRHAPDDQRLLEAAIELLEERGEHAELEQLLLRLIGLAADPQRTALELRLARHRQRQGDRQGALTLLTRMVSEERADDEALELITSLLELEEDWRQAAELYEKRAQQARAAGDRQSEQQLQERLLHLLTTKISGSSQTEAICRHLLELQPAHPAAHAHLATLYQDREDWPALVSLLEAQLAQVQRGESYLTIGEEFRLVSGLALALDRSGQSAEAAHQLESTMKLALQERKLLWPLTGLARDLGVVEIELRCLAALSVEAPSDPEIQLRLAQLQQQAGDEAAARHTLAVSLPLLPPGPQRQEAARLLLILADAAMPDSAPANLLDHTITALSFLFEEGATPDESWRLARLLADIPDRQAEALAIIDDLPLDYCRSEAQLLRWRLLGALGRKEELAADRERVALKLSDPAQRAERLLDVVRVWGEQVGNLSAASRCARAAAEAQPSDLERLERIGRLFGDLDAWGRYFELLEQLAAADGPGGPLQAEILCLAARARQARGETPRKVEAIYRQALERDPQCLPALTALRRFYCDLSDYEKLAEIMLLIAESGREITPRVDALLEAAALFSQRLQRPQEALPLLKRARELRPEEPKVLQAVADLYQLLGDLWEAEEALLALAYASNDPEPALNRACGLARLRGDAPAEAQYLNHLVRLKPGDRRGFLRLATAYRASGDIRGLCTVLESLADIDQEALLELARIHADSLEDFSSAYDYYSRFLAEQPEHRESLQTMVEICERLDKQEEAVRYLRRLRDLEPAGLRQLELTTEIARREEELGHWGMAEEGWRSALNSSPGDPIYLTRLAENLVQQQHWEPLTQLLEEKLSSSSYERAVQVRLATLLGEVYLDHLEDEAAAIRWLQQASSLSVRNETPFRRLMAIYRRRKNYAEAAELLELRIRQLTTANRSALWQELAYLREVHLKDFKGAADAYAACFREDLRPELKHATRGLEHYLNCGELDAALGLLDDAIARSDENTRPSLQVTHAQILAMRGLISEAIEEYEQVLKKAPTLYQAHAELGKQLFGQGMFGAALPHLQKAGENLDDPKQAAACTFLAARVLEKLGLADEAIASYERAASKDNGLKAAYEALIPHYENRNQWERLAHALSLLSSLTVENRVRAALLAKLGAVQLRRERKSEAYHCYLNALSLDPELTEALTPLRQLAYERQEWSRCVELLKREIQLQQDPHASAHLQRQLGLLYAGPLQDREAAIVCLQTALEQNPSDQEAAAALVPLLERVNRFTDAGRIAERIARLTAVRREQRDFLRRAADNYLAAGLELDHRRISKELLRWERDLDERTPTPLPASRFWMATRKGGSGASSLDETQVTPGGIPHPLEADSWLVIAESFRAQAAHLSDPRQRADVLITAARTIEERLEQPIEAMVLYGEAAAIVPDYLPAVEALADAAYRNQDWYRARELYDQLCNEEPSRGKAETHFRRGLIYETLGDLETAEGAYATALALDPKHCGGLEGTARIALLNDEIETALSAMTTLEGLVPVEEVETLADLREQLGKLQQQQGNLAQARHYLEGALSLDPNSTQAMQSLLGVYEGQGDFKAMVGLLDQLICLTPDPLVRASLLFHRAEIFGSKLSDEKSAIADLLKAYDLSEDYPPTLWRLVDYYWDRGELDAVVEMGDHLLTGNALEAPLEPDLRLARLAVVYFISGRERELSLQLLRSCFEPAPLREAALLELARGVTLGCNPETFASLLREALPAAELLQLMAKLQQKDPEAPGLEPLAKALETP